MFAFGNYQFAPASFANLAASVIAVLVALAAWQRRRESGASSLILLELASAFWAFCNFFEAAALNVELKNIWSQISYLGIVSTPVFFFIFALEYSGYQNLLSQRNLLFIFLVPIATLLIVFTNNTHHLHWSNIYIIPETNLAIYERGAWFWVFTAYVYSLVLIGVLTLIWSVFRFADHYRYQIASIVIGALMPFIGNIIYLTDLNPVPGLDWTPITFTFTGIVLILGIFRLGIFQLIPIARKQLVESMSDGMLVIDQKHRIVDLNPAAKRYFSHENEFLIGKPADRIVPGWPVDFVPSAVGASQGVEIAITNPSNTILNVRVIPLRDARRTESGWLLVVRDISAEKKIESDLRQANTRLREQIVEIEALKETLREDSIRDALTGAFNRRFLSEYLQQVLLSAKHHQRPVSIIMLDIDRFKGFNDSYGHEAGDQTLKDVVELINKDSRSDDAICRYGGEEFVVVLPGATLAHAYKRAESWRQALEELTIHNQGRQLHITVSFGVAQFPIHGITEDAVLRSADAALYRAKESGRNLVCTPPSDLRISKSEA